MAFNKYPAMRLITFYPSQSDKPQTPTRIQVTTILENLGPGWAGFLIALPCIKGSAPATVAVVLHYIHPLLQVCTQVLLRPIVTVLQTAAFSILQMSSYKTVTTDRSVLFQHSIAI